LWHMRATHTQAGGQGDNRALREAADLILGV
jgi:hypothetical protein